MIGALALLALSADFIANDKPYYMKLDGESYAPIAIDYGVLAGPARVAGAAREPAHRASSPKRADTVWWPPIPYSPSVPDIRGDVFEPPSRAHWLGTDGLGRDVAAGMIHGIRIVAHDRARGRRHPGDRRDRASARSPATTADSSDLALSRLIELMLAIPTFFLLLVVAATFPPSIYWVMAILGLTGWVGIARFVRGEFLKVRAMDYVAAAQSLGASRRAHHAAPRAAQRDRAGAGVDVVRRRGRDPDRVRRCRSSASACPRSVVTWGSILSVAQSNTTAWWLAVFPGAAIFITVLAYNLLGDGLRDALDPREQGT